MQRLTTLPGAALGACGLASLLLTSCAEPPGSGRSPISETLNSVSFDPPASAGGPISVTPAGSAGGGDSAGPDRKPQVYLGSSTAAQATTTSPLGTQVRRTQDGVEVNFDRADVHEVAKVILGEILKVPYTVDPRVSGEVTLATGGPVSERDLVAALETVLAGLNATVVDHAGTYAIVPSDDLQGPAAVQPLGGSGIKVQPGFGVTIVPLRYMSATAAAQFVQPLLHRAEDIRVDPSRNLILFAGSTAERQNVVETLSELDVDWLSGKSVGIFPLNVATPEAIIPELDALFGAGTAAADPTTGLVRFMPMARLNAVLAIANSPQQIVQAQSWVNRLDRGTRGVGAQFYVYQLKHAPADEIAKVLAESFSDTSSSSGGTSPSSLFGGAVEPPSPFGTAPAPGDNSGAQPDVQSPVPYGAGAGGGQPSGGPTTGTSLSPVFGGAGAGTGAGGAFGTSGPLIGGVKIVPNKLNNTLLIRATPQVYEMMEAALRRLDTAPLQVLIEATIAEVTLNNQLRYGVQYYFDSGSFKAGFNGTATAGAVASTAGNLTPLASVPGFNFIYTGGNSNITIDALSAITDVKVLSSPSVVVQDNSEAVLTVGEEVPIITRTSTSVDTADAPLVANVEYRDTGVILEVKPRVNTEQVVSLDIAQEVSRVSDAPTAGNQASTLSPTFTQRKITSKVNVTSGQTVVLGGLIQDSETRSNKRIPLLGDIPVVGNLFGDTNNVGNRTELIVFITPKVIRNADDARDVSEELRSRMRSLRPADTFNPAIEPPPSIPGSPAPGGTMPGGPTPVVPPPTATPVPTFPYGETPPPKVSSFAPVEPAPDRITFDATRTPVPMPRPGPVAPQLPAIRPDSEPGTATTP